MVDPAVKAIICVRGGFGGVEVIPHLDLGKIRAAAKFFVGFSDITYAHHVLLRGTKVRAIHGPMVASCLSRVGNDPLRRQSAEALFELLSGNEPSAYKEISLKPVVNKGAVSGPITGGNLAVFQSLIGTQFFPTLEGKVLFLEDINERPSSIFRMLWHLKNQAGFKNLAGVVLGNFSDCEPKDLGPNDQSLADVFGSVFGDVPFPVWSGFPAGHESLNIAFPLETKVRISLDGRFSLAEPVL